MTKVRTRFAPSPTGMLHIGGFRSALYAWLFARHHGGDFVLRIEDTDQERRVKGAVKYILDGFAWFGIDIDEGPTAEQIEEIDGAKPDYAPGKGDYGPYVQSLRIERYQEVVQQLIDSGHAYRCDCTAERLDKERAEQKERKEDVPGYSGFCRDREVSKDTQHVVRFKMPENPHVVMEDGIRGKIEWDSIPLRDPVLLKGDGFPTYHLAVVVDDHDMEITHTMRGEEWIPSAPLHLLLYQALGWEAPIFCHLPVVLGDDGKKLSKRHGSTSWSSFKEDGYLPDALLNFIVRIGWSLGDGDDQEIFTREELIEKFSLERVNSAPGVFEYAKLDWMNGVYLRELSDDQFFTLTESFLRDADLSFDKEEIAPLLPQLKERVKSLTEVAGFLSFLKDEHFAPDMSQVVTKKVSGELAVQILTAVKEKFAEVGELSIEAIGKVFEDVAAELSVKAGAVFLSVRIAVLGKKATPPLPESIQVLGKDRAVSRLEQSIPLIPLS